MAIVKYIYNFGKLELNFMITNKTNGINKYRITLTGSPSINWPVSHGPNWYSKEKNIFPLFKPISFNRIYAEKGVRVHGT